MELVTLGIGFLLGILGAGFGVVLEQIVVGHFRDAALRRALIAEMRENLQRLAVATDSDVPGASIVRSAWDAAHGIHFESDVFSAIALAYKLGAELEAYAAFIVGRVMRRGVALRGFPEHRAREGVLDLARQMTRATRDAFTNALQSLDRD